MDAREKREAERKAAGEVDAEEEEEEDDGEAKDAEVSPGSRVSGPQSPGNVLKPSHMLRYMLSMHMERVRCCP